MVGRTLSHYKIIKKLGEGGMGDVYLARDEHLGRKIAIKLLPQFGNGGKAEKRFQREAQALAALNHPNIVTLYSLEEDGEKRFLTMEWVRGKVLTDIVPFGGLPLELFYDLAVQIANALETTHREGFIHRDLKPANIMVTGRWEVKILDFGLVKLRESLEERLTDTGKVVGSVPYMSPEQLQGQDVDQATDIFNVGLVLFEMLAGLRPFRGRRWGAACAILDDEPLRAGDLRSDIPAALDGLIARCLSKKSHRRPTAAVLAAELAGLRAEAEADRKPSWALRGLGQRCGLRLRRLLERQATSSNVPSHA